jgi:hypothetical protein
MFQFSAFATLAGYGLSRGLPHSEILGSKLVCQLPEAYRRLLRPSSPVAAKASTRCAWSLDHITSRILANTLGDTVNNLYNIQNFRRQAP